MNLQVPLARPSGLGGKGDSCALLFEINRIDLIIAACGEVAGRDVREAVCRTLAEAAAEKWSRAVDAELDQCGRFLVTIPALNAGELEALASEWCERVSGVSIRRSWGEVYVTLSVGGVVSQVSAVNRKVLGLWAASALDDGRRRGSRQVRIVQASGSLAHWYMGTIAILADVRRAVDSGRAELAFQPILGVEGEVYYYEGLIRLTDERGVKMLPGEFIPPLEQLGMMGWLDRFVFEKLIVELRNDPSAVLGCNVSGQTICDRRWMKQVFRVFNDEPQLVRRAVIEVTETGAIFDLIKAADHIMKLRELGCRVALDDFDAGFASFAHLASLGVDIVKIDQGFLSGRPAEGGWMRQISHLAGLAGGLGAEVVVEGVESDDQLQVLQIPNVSHVQAYRFGYPSAYRRWRQARAPFFTNVEGFPTLSEEREAK